MPPLSEPGRFRIKQAAAQDLLPAARVKAQAWRESYDLDEDLFAHQDAQVERAAGLWAERSRRGEYFWVVTDLQQHGEIVGVAHARASADAGAPTPLELSMIYLLDRAKGSGIADRLLEMAIGDAPAFLWVLEDNPRAQAFYRRHGFVADGGRAPVGDTGLHEIRMVRGVSA